VSFLPFFILLVLLGSVKGNSRCRIHSCKSAMS
jgi:hypothetical protein